MSLKMSKKVSLDFHFLPFMDSNDSKTEVCKHSKKWLHFGCILAEFWLNSSNFSSKLQSFQMHWAQGKLYILDPKNCKTEGK